MTDDTSLAPDTDPDTSISYTGKLGILADLHYTTDTASDVVDQIDTALTQFEAADVDRIVVLGDLIKEADSEPKTKKLLRDAISLFDDIDTPVTHLLGNHDVVHTDWDDFHVQTGDDPRTGTFDITDSITGIYLDTSAPQHADARGALSDYSLEYLDKELADAEYAVVFTHHPIHYHDLHDDGHFVEHPEVAFASNKYRATELIQEHGNVIAGVNGHTHIADHTTYRDVPFFTINGFTEERPGYEGVNGSFAIMDVSRPEVKVHRHIHGEYDRTDTVQYPAGDEKVALGGTFGPIHDGHRKMFRRAFEAGDVLIGLTSDDLAQQTRHEPRPVPDWTDRREQLEAELEPLADRYNREYTIKKLTDPMGHITDDPSFTHLIVSPETFSRGETVNTKRIENGLAPLELEVVEPALADDGQRISSTRIVKGEIDQHGHIVDQ